jgi:carboxyl-terminal processing protease
VRIAALLLPLLLCIVLPALAEPFVPGQTLDAPLIARVTASALAFMQPRTLELVPTWQLAMWGLRGLTTLDERLAVDLREGTLRLSAGARTLATRRAPGRDDAAGWGEATAQLVRVGWDASEAVRRSGTQGVLRSFFDELFNHLDPYSRYASPAEAQADRIRRAGRAGIGVELARRRAGVEVREVAADGPAALAGVRRGDRVLAVNGQTIAGADLASVGALLGGPEGTGVSVAIRSPDGRVRTVSLVRALVPPETVKAVRIGDLLLLRISGFSSDTAARMAHEIEHGTAGPHPPRGLVLDLRGNPGGLLRQAASAAGTLIPRGLVARTVGRNPAATHEFRAGGVDLAHGLPVVVMVDGRSASAAEILAAALADEGRAVVVGSSTLGKGLVQTITSLPDGGDLAITWSRVLAPLGWPIQGLGVLPQVCTSLGGEQLARQLAELRQHQSLLQAALIRHRSARAPLPPAEMLEIRSACPAAEGQDADFSTAHMLIETPPAYAAALLPGG